jgi:integrase
MMDHISGQDTAPEAGQLDMTYLSKPRNKGYAFRMVTPEALVGSDNPLTGRPFGKEIKLGLGTRRHTEALRIRDIYLGQVRQLEAEARRNQGKQGDGRIFDLSPEAAKDWLEMRKDFKDTDAIDHVLLDELVKAGQGGRQKAAKSFADVVFKGAMLIEKAMEQYLDERQEGNRFNNKPLAITTALDVRTSVRHLIAFLGQEAPTLNDVTEDKVFNFRTAYLLDVKGLKPQTVSKHMTLMRGLWTWAISEKRYLRAKGSKPYQNPWIIEEVGTPKNKRRTEDSDDGRKAFQPEDIAKLLQGCNGKGSRQGDILRLALATGCRVDEIGSLKLEQVKPDGTGFHILRGKTHNAKRYIPATQEAMSLLAERYEAVKSLQASVATAEQRLFPEWPLKPATGKANSVSQWFTRYRRRVLGVETDGRLVMHSFRHTWRTVARRAGVAEDRIRELGGWRGERDTADEYDHGLLEQQLTEEQGKIWEALKAQGYLEYF